MKPRERVKIALSHEEPDRPPIDLGGTVSGIHNEAYTNLVSHLGLSLPTITDLRDVQQLARQDDSILKRLGVDFRHVSLRTIPGPGSIVVDRSSGRMSFVDEWGVKWGRNPHYYDMIDHPLKGATVEDLMDFPWPNPRDPRRTAGLRGEARRIYEETDLALQADAFYGGIYECAWWMRGFETFTVDMYRRPEFTEALLDRILDLYLDFYDEYLDEVGPYLQIVDYNDDIGMQTGPLISPVMFRRYLKPRYKRIFDLIHSKTSAKLFLHSCGSCYPFIPDLIEIGLEVLNPIQPLAAKMEIGGLKREFGDRLTFHGGIDIQRLIPYGTPAEIETEVKRVAKIAGAGGGLIIAGAHNIQGDTPPRNVLALYETAKHLKSRDAAL